MRIIAGKHKGRKLNAFDGVDIRPTSDRAREALFNTLQNDIFGAAFYDGFAGSGAVGIEALSRGAVVTMTDVSPKSIKLIKDNLALIGEKADVLQEDCIGFLKRTDKKFDVIFLDPPYALDVLENALRVIGERKILTENGLVIVEKDEWVAVEVDGLKFLKEKKYGKAKFTYYRAEEE